MNNGIRVTRLRRVWPPRVRTLAAIIATASLALAPAAYGSRPSASRARASSNAHKVPPSSKKETPQQAAQDYAQLLGWTKCMRHRGYPELPDPKRGTPQPMGGHGGAVLGWGAAYLIVPAAYDVYSQAFEHKAKSCGIDPVTGNPHH
jgi:hypothetical protein